jgi:hypothetical protein
MTYSPCAYVMPVIAETVDSVELHAHAALRRCCCRTIRHRAIGETTVRSE